MASKSFFTVGIIALAIIGNNYCEAIGLGEACTLHADCGTTMGCNLKTAGTLRACSDKCTTDAECGTGITCGDVPDGTAGTPLQAKLCVIAAVTYPLCSLTGAGVCTGATPVCDPFVLKCGAATTTTSSTMPTTLLVSTSLGGLVTNPPCVDLVSGGDNGCGSMKALCTNALYINLLKAKCPKTCGYCISTTNIAGQNLINPRTGISDCTPDKKYLCTKSVYRKLMLEQCPVLCRS
uniref:ShKT domain-containing protein n=1 Tax=Rhabditophanes sp. KR3021 TaxID=114890 RepID=A0AC35UEF7_9BILA